MNEPASFVNGAVPPGCKDATLNHPPYMPCKSPRPPLLAEPWLRGHDRHKRHKSSDYSGHILTGAVVWGLGGARQIRIKHFIQLRVYTLLALLGEFLRFVQKTLNCGYVPRGFCLSFLILQASVNSPTGVFLCCQWVESRSFLLSGSRWTLVLSLCSYLGSRNCVTITKNCVTINRLLDVSESLL